MRMRFWRNGNALRACVPLRRAGKAETCRSASRRGAGKRDAGENHLHYKKASSH